MELWVIAALAFAAGAGIGGWVGHSTGLSKAGNLFSAAKAGLSADEQSLVDLWRKVTGKGVAAPAGSGGGSSATVIAIPTPTPPTATPPPAA